MILRLSFLIELEFGKVENRSTWRNSSRSKGENQQLPQPTKGVDAWIWTQATLLGGECSQHCAILVLLCFPLWIIYNIVEYHCSLISAPSPFWELARAWNWGPSEDQVCLCPVKEERLVECDSSFRIISFLTLKGVVSRNLSKFEYWELLPNCAGHKESFRFWDEGNYVCTSTRFSQ